MDIIKKLMKISKENLNDYIENLIAKSIDTRRLICENKTSDDNKIKLLVNDTFSFNLCMSCIFLLELKSHNKTEKELYISLSQKLKDYNLIYNTDINLLKISLELCKKIEDVDKKFFLLRTIKSMEKFGTCSKDYKKVYSLLKNIEITENIINDILEKPLKINIDRNKIDAQSESIVSSVYPNKQNLIYVCLVYFY